MKVFINTLAKKIANFKKASKEAFTLIEMLVVLVALSLFLIIASVPSHDGLQTAVENDLFFEELERNIKLTHEWSGYNRSSSRVNFNTSRQQVMFYHGYRRELDFQLDLPDDLYLVNNLEIEFRDVGVTGGRFGTATFKSRSREDIIYSVVFQIGSGQFYVKKEGLRRY